MLVTVHNMDYIKVKLTINNYLSSVLNQVLVSFGLLRKTEREQLKDVIKFIQAVSHVKMAIIHHVKFVKKESF